ncbi:MAG: V-type ATP synthase subunit F [Treponema sp.]|nr:ATPase V [Spirochaetaceae bacterium]MEE0134169.1 V-type ATP synthase subunit F [Treponema sp.]
MEYYFIGERELVLAFSLVGVAGTAVSTREQALAAFVWATEESHGEERPKILILSEQAASLLEQEVVACQMQVSRPLIVEIPGLQGRLKGKKSLTDLIREAIGMHI